ncbi:MAG TPA: hypothetical protein VIK52_01215 [Opitutaceae bacterium]
MADHDPTEAPRRALLEVLNILPHDNRAEVEACHGKVWNTEELQAEFTVTSFMAPFVGVIRKSDGKEGALEFAHSPRWYFNWQEG